MVLSPQRGEGMAYSSSYPGNTDLGDLPIAPLNALIADYLGSLSGTSSSPYDLNNGANLCRLIDQVERDLETTSTSHALALMSHIVSCSWMNVNDTSHQSDRQRPIDLIASISKLGEAMTVLVKNLERSKLSTDAQADAQADAFVVIMSLSALTALLHSKSIVGDSLTDLLLPMDVADRILKAIASLFSQDGEYSTKRLLEASKGSYILYGI